MKIENREFEIYVPKADGTGIAETVKVMVPVCWDEEVKEWLMTPEAHEIIENTKARLIGLLLPEQFAELRKRYNYTQQQMGELFQAGEKSWNRWETGYQRPSRSINLLIRALYEGEISIDYLLKKAGKPPFQQRGDLHFETLQQNLSNLYESPQTSKQAFIEYTDESQSRWQWLIARVKHDVQDPAILSGVVVPMTTAQAGPNSVMPDVAGVMRTRLKNPTAA